MKSTDNTGATGFLYACISSRVMEQAIQRGIDAGVKAAMEHIRTEREKERKSRQDRRLHNTRLLLKKLPAPEGAYQGSQLRANQARERAVDILDGLNDYEMDDGLYIESIKKSQQRTIIILAHIDQMLELYKAYCYNSGNPENIRRYGVVMATYIDEPKKVPSKLRALLASKSAPFTRTSKRPQTRSPPCFLASTACGWNSKIGPPPEGTKWALTIHFVCAKIDSVEDWI